MPNLFHCCCSLEEIIGLGQKTISIYVILTVLICKNASRSRNIVAYLKVTGFCVKRAKAHTTAIESTRSKVLHFARTAPSFARIMLFKRSNATIFSNAKINTRQIAKS